MNRLPLAVSRLARHPLARLAAVLLVLPLINPSKTLSIQILIWGLFAVSYNLLLGYTGLLSFGHATFFGIGSYAAGLFLKHVAPSALVSLVLGLLVAALAAFVVGWFCLRRRGVYFAMLTLAFGQMVYFVGFQWTGLTGGDDGLRGIPTPPVGLPGVAALPITSVQHPYAFYYFALAVVLLALAAQARLMNAPFGHALQAIRESEERARAVGYDTTRVQLVAYVFAGAFAGLAGALNALYLGFVPLESLSLYTGGAVLMMTVLGGKGTLIGPFLGAAVYWTLEDFLSRVIDSWPLVVGAIFVACVLLLPRGLGGSLAWIARARRPRPRDGVAA